MRLKLDPMAALGLVLVIKLPVLMRVDPLRNWPVLPPHRGKLHLDVAGLVGRHFENVFLLLQLSSKGTKKTLVSKDLR